MNDSFNFDWENGLKLISSEFKNVKSKKYYDSFFSFESLDLKNIYEFLFVNKVYSTSKTIGGFTQKREVSDVGQIFKQLMEFVDFPMEVVKMFKMQKASADGFCNYFGKINNALPFFNAAAKYCLYSALNADFPFDDASIKADGIVSSGIPSDKPFDHIDHVFMFRGQENFSWWLTPSLIRDIEIEKGDGLLIDINSMFGLYNENGFSDSLREKYNRCFPNRKVISPSDIDYRFLSWMQHSVSFSPLLDFTSDPNVALRFALRASHPSSFLFSDSALFTLALPNDFKIYMNEEEVNQIISKMIVLALKMKIKPGTIVNVFDLYGNCYPLDFRSYYSILWWLIPNFAVINIPTNDRMLRQRGKFILFYDYVSVRGKMFLALEDEFYISRTKIAKKQKDSVLKQLNSNFPDLKMSYLMNPYSYFDD